MRLLTLLAACGLATTSAAFLGGVATARQAPMCLADRSAALRCASPLLMADQSGEEAWGTADDAALAEYVAMRASAARCGEPDSVLRGMDAAYVLIFNLGKSDEGVYTLQGRQSAASAYVLAFEFTDDADRFAQLLQAEGFDLATPLRWDTSQLAAFCSAGDFEVSLVPQGALLTPPSKNEYDRDAFDRLENPEAAMMAEAEASDAFASQRAAFERLFNEGPELGPPGI